MDKFDKFQLIGDWLKNLIERAKEIDINEGDYHEGILRGYYESISHILIQIEVLGFMEDLNDEYLSNFNPDDLLNGTATTPFNDNEKEN